MAENNWLLNDSTPAPIAQEFSAAAAAKAWGWFGMPASGEGSEFDAAPTPWAFDFSIVTDQYMWTAEAPPVGGAAVPMMLLGVGGGVG